MPDIPFIRKERKMKKIIFGLALFIFLGAFIACDNSNSSGDLGITPTNPGRFAFNAQYVHTQYVQGTWTSGIDYPRLTVISSRAALDQYFNDYEGLYDFSRYQYSPTGFMDAIENYSEAFFGDNFLVLVLLEETSGSNRHRVENITDNGNITITRRIPEIGASDMAQWHIIIELDKEDKFEQYQVVFLEERL